MDWLWTWSGRCFGYRDGDDLRTYGGKHVGRFADDDVYGPDGSYLGEVRAGRLIRRKVGKSPSGTAFTPHAKVQASAKSADQAANQPLLGYEDFPKLEGS